MITVRHYNLKMFMQNRIKLYNLKRGKLEKLFLHAKS